MFTRKNLSTIIFMLLYLCICFPSHAQQNETPNWWQQVKNRTKLITEQGDNMLYLSGYIHHGHGTYTPEKLTELNAKGWGLGYGKILRNDRGNDESLYGFVISDSHKKPQTMVGYAYEWVWQAGSGPLEVSLGGTAMLVSRMNMFNGIPFPAVTPLASVGIQQAKVMFSYVPRLSKNKNNGDVLFIFGRIKF